MKAIHLITFLFGASLLGIAQQQIKPAIHSAPVQSDPTTNKPLADGAHIENDWGIPVEVFPDGSRKPLWKGNADKVKSAPVISADSPEAKVHPARIKKPASSATQNPISKDDQQKKSNTNASATTSDAPDPAPGDTSTGTISDQNAPTTDQKAPSN